MAKTVGKKNKTGHPKRTVYLIVTTDRRGNLRNVSSSACVMLHQKKEVSAIRVGRTPKSNIDPLGGKSN